MKKEYSSEQIWLAIQEISHKIDVRFTKVDQRFNEVGSRFDKMDNRLDEMDARIEQSFELIEENYEEMQEFRKEMQKEFKLVHVTLEYQKARREIQDRVVTNHEVRIKKLETAKA